MARKPITNSNINGNEYYRTRLLIGYDTNGKKIMKNFYGSSKTEAENKKKEYAQMLESGINPKLGSISLEKALSAWLWDIERYSGNKTSTFERYESVFRNHIQGSAMGRVPVLEINKLVIQRFYNEILEKGNSPKSIEFIRKVLSKFFQFALSEGYIVRNPIQGMKLPTKHEENISDQKTEIETFSKEDLKLILDSVGNVKLRYIIMFATLTGARIGEILALEKDDIKGDVLKINKSIRNVRVYADQNNYHYEFKVTRPKSESSIREIPIPQKLKLELKNLSILVKEERLKLGPAYTENILLFPSTTGTYLDVKNVRTSWKRALKNTDIPHKKFHTLRHTYATQLIKNGVTLLTVSRLLGHSSIKTTEIYAHTLEETKIEAVNTLNNMFA